MAAVGNVRNEFGMSWNVSSGESLYVNPAAAVPAIDHLFYLNSSVTEPKFPALGLSTCSKVPSPELCAWVRLRVCLRACLLVLLLHSTRYSGNKVHTQTHTDTYSHIYKRTYTYCLLVCSGTCLL